MPIPSVLQAPTNHNWVSSSVANAALLKPTVDPTLYRRYGDQNMTGLLELMGGMNPVSSLEYIHYEDDFLHSIVKVDAQGAGGAGAAVTFAVAAAYQYVFPGSAQSPYIATGAVTTNPVRLQDILTFPDGTQAIVTARTTTGFTCYPLISGETIPQTFSTTQIAITGNAHEEGTDQPASRNSRVIKYINNMQIYKGNHTTTGSAMGEQIWIEVKDQNGNTGYLWYYEGQLREYKRFKNEREINMVTGVKLTNATLAAVQPTLTTTEALIPAIENSGNITTYSLITGIVRTDWENMIITQLDKNRGAKENTVWSGITLRAGIDRFIGAEMKNGGITYNVFGGNKEQTVNFGFDSFQMLGYTFHLKTYDVFNYPQMLGAAGQPYTNMALVIPADKTVASIGPEKTKTEVPTLRINYVSQKNAGGSYSRQFEEWMLGGANGIYTQGVDQVSYNVRSHSGFEIFCPNRFVQIINA